MDFWDITRLLLRRWYVATPLLVVTLIVGVWTYTSVQPDYKGVSYVQLIPPAAPTTQDEAVQICNAVDVTNLANQFPLFMGAPWVNGQHVFQHVNVPNARSCGFFTILRASMPPSSRHPGGVNLLLGDGSVRFVKSSVNLAAWRALGTRAGNEAVSADSY